jgi:heat shock protein HtpX
MRRWNNQRKTIFFLGLLSALVVGAGGALGGPFLPGAVVLAIAINGFGWFFSDRIVLRMHGAREVVGGEAPELDAMIRGLSAAAGVPKPRLYAIDEPQPNAFATGRNPENAAIAVTRGLLELLPRRELRGVIAHEIAHVRSRDTLIATLAAGMAAAIGYVAHVVQMSMLFGGDSRDDEEDGGGAGGLVVALVAPMVATIVQLAVSRSREFLADETAAELTGDPLALASALSRLEHGAARIPPAAPQPATASLFIVSPLAGASIAGLFATHPPTAARIERLEAMAAGRELRAS